MTGGKIDRSPASDGQEMRVERWQKPTSNGEFYVLYCTDLVGIVNLEKFTLFKKKKKKSQSWTRIENFFVNIRQPVLLTWNGLWVLQHSTSVSYSTCHLKGNSRTHTSVHSHCVQRTTKISAVFLCDFPEFLKSNNTVTEAKCSAPHAPIYTPIS